MFSEETHQAFYISSCSRNWITNSEFFLQLLFFFLVLHSNSSSCSAQWEYGEFTSSLNIASRRRRHRSRVVVMGKKWERNKHYNSINSVIWKIVGVDLAVNGFVLCKICINKSHKRIARPLEAGKEGGWKARLSEREFVWSFNLIIIEDRLP